MPLEATLLQNHVQGPSFVHCRTNTVDKGVHLQEIDANLACIVALLLILEVLREKNLSKCAIRVVKIFPGRRVKLLSESREGDEALTTVFHLGIINAFVHLLDVDSIEWLFLLELRIAVKAGDIWCR